MNDSKPKLAPFADLRVKTGSYEKDGQTKNRYTTIGTLLSSPHHSNMVIRIEAMPVSKDWDGTIYVNKRDSWQQDATEDKTQDVVTTDNIDEPVKLEDIPF